MYGSFNALTYDIAKPHFQLCPLEEAKEEKKISTTLWGQTCDSADCIYENMHCNGLRSILVTCYLFIDSVPILTPHILYLMDFIITKFFTFIKMKMKHQTSYKSFTKISL